MAGQPDFLYEIRAGFFSLIDIPDEYKTYQICLEACKQDIYDIKNVPEQYLTYGFLRELSNEFLQFFPEEIKNTIQIALKNQDQYEKDN